jgi:hypothetical protein
MVKDNRVTHFPTREKPADAPNVSGDDRNCENCCYSKEQQKPPPEIGKQRVCLWGPKQVTLIPMQGGMAIVAGMPPVADSDFCFQHAYAVEPSINTVS